MIHTYQIHRSGSVDFVEFSYNVGVLTGFLVVFFIDLEVDAFINIYAHLILKILVTDQREVFLSGKFASVRIFVTVNICGINLGLAVDLELYLAGIGVSEHNVAVGCILIIIISVVETAK